MPDQVALLIMVQVDQLTMGQAGRVIQVQVVLSTQAQVGMHMMVLEAQDIQAQVEMHTMVQVVQPMMVPEVLVILAQVGRVIQGLVARVKIALMFAGKKASTHNKPFAADRKKPRPLKIALGSKQPFALNSTLYLGTM